MTYFRKTKDKNYRGLFVTRIYLVSSRPATSFRWFTSPFKTLRYIIWRNYKWIIIGILITIIIVAAVVIFLYSMPVSVLILVIRDVK